MDRSSPRPHYGPRNALRRSTAREKEAKLHENMLVSEGLLKRYKEYVQNNIEPQIELYRTSCDELGQEVERLQSENERLTAEIDSMRESQQHQRATETSLAQNFQTQLSRMITEREQSTEALRKAHSTEVQTLKQELDHTKEELARVKSSNIDPAVQRRLNDLELTLQIRDSEVHRLQQKASDTETLLSTAERRAVEVAPIASALSTVIGEIRAFVQESCDFSAQISHAYAHIGADTTSSVAAWKNLLQNAGSLSGASDRSLHDVLDELSLLCVGMRSSSRQEKAVFREALKSLVVRQQEMKDLLSQKAHERQVERELEKKRMDELEHDRRAERDQLLQAVERERMRVMLASSNASSAKSVSGSGGEQSNAARRSFACQTSIDLLEHSGAKEETLSRLYAEIHQLQSEIARQRETISVMEHQRKQFMSFAGDEIQVSTVLSAALSGGSLDFIFSDGAV